MGSWRDGPPRGEIARRRRVRAELADAAREAVARATPVVLPAPGTGWPDGVALDAPGVLTIRFGSGGELLGTVLALADQAARDYTGFEARLDRAPDLAGGEGMT